MPVTALLAAPALDALDIPFYLDGTRIDLSAISLEVAEVCNGLRFLTGVVVMTIAFAWVTQRTLPRGLILAGAAIPVAILANAIRVAAVVAAVHYIGPEAASGTIHNWIGKSVWGLTLLPIGVLGLVLRRGTGRKRGGTERAITEGGGRSMSVASRRARAWTVLLIVIALAFAACARSPEATKARHLARGDAYFQRGQYRAAILEYRNVLRVELTNARAIQQLGLAHYHAGEWGQALRYLVKAREVAPDNLGVRLKFGAISLAGGRHAEAHEQASAVLPREPRNVEALVLLAGGAQAPADVDAAIRRLQEARAEAGSSAKLLLALGALHLRQRDPGAAERAFREAVAREPKLIEARLALGELYLGRRDPAQAEREFKAAAELAPAGSPTQLWLADFYGAVQKPEEAKRILGEITRKAPDALPAWRRLAKIAFAERQYDETGKLLDIILKKNPSDLGAYLLRGRAHLAQRKTAEAAQDFGRALKLEPKLAEARFHLALTHILAGNPQQAKTDLKEAVTTRPALSRRDWSWRS